MRKYIFTIVLITLISACNKDNQHPIPDVPIYIEPIFIYDAEFNSLLDLYGMVTLKNEGYLGNGIVVVNVGFDEYGTYNFMAYDATCPNEVKEGCIVESDASSISLVECSCCGSKYEVTFGDIYQGPSTYPLKTYKTAFDGELIRIY